MTTATPSPSFFVGVATLSMTLTLALCISGQLKAVARNAHQEQSSSTDVGTVWTQPAVHARAAALLQQANVEKERNGDSEYPPMALNWLHEAATSGYAEAQFELGRYYGRRLEYEKSIMWLEASAYRGVVDAQHLMCLSYALGRGVTKNTVKAYAWCALAQDLGSAAAADTLATLMPILDREHLRRAVAVRSALERALP